MLTVWRHNDEVTWSNQRRQCFLYCSTVTLQSWIFPVSIVVNKVGTFTEIYKFELHNQDINNWECVFLQLSLYSVCSLSSLPCYPDQFFTTELCRTKWCCFYFKTSAASLAIWDVIPTAVYLFLLLFFLFGTVLAILDIWLEANISNVDTYTAGVVVEEKTEHWWLKAWWEMYLSSIESKEGPT